MNIVIAGGGRVGFNLARTLCGESHDVTVLESDPSRCEQIDYALDARTVTGNGASVSVLQEVGIPSVDLFVSSMGNDETNLLAASTAKGLGARQVIARVDNPMYVDDNILYETLLGVDFILSPDALAGLEIVNYIEHPGVLGSREFGRGRVSLRQILVDHSPTLNGKTVKDVMPPGGGVLLGLVERNGAATIPDGMSVIEPGDLITLVGHREALSASQRMFQGAESKPQRVAIMGGGTLGLRVAQALEGRLRTVKVFERRTARAQELANMLPKAKIVCRDAASRLALEQEHIAGMDVFVAATNDDERNILTGVLAKEVGAKRVVTIVHQPDFAPLVKRLGIDLAVTPRASVANRVLNLVHARELTSIAVLAEGQIEVVEFEVHAGSPLLGKPIKDARNRLPRTSLIASLIRDDHVVVPSGDDEIRVGDSVVLITTPEGMDSVQRLIDRRS